MYSEDAHTKEKKKSTDLGGKRKKELPSHQGGQKSKKKARGNGKVEMLANRKEKLEGKFLIPDGGGTLLPGRVGKKKKGHD